MATPNVTWVYPTLALVRTARRKEENVRIIECNQRIFQGWETLARTSCTNLCLYRGIYDAVWYGTSIGAYPAVFIVVFMIHYDMASREGRPQLSLLWSLWCIMIWQVGRGAPSCLYCGLYDALWYGKSGGAPPAVFILVFIKHQGVARREGRPQLSGCLPLLKVSGYGTSGAAPPAVRVPASMEGIWVWHVGSGAPSCQVASLQGRHQGMACRERRPQVSGCQPPGKASGYGTSGAVPPGVRMRASREASTAEHKHPKIHVYTQL